MITVKIDDLNTITLECLNALSFKGFCQLLGKECNLSDDDKLKLYVLSQIIEDGVLDRYALSTDFSKERFPTCSKRDLSFYPLKPNDSVTIKGNRESTFRNGPSSQFSKNTTYILSSSIEDEGQDAEIINSELLKIQNSWSEAAKISEIYSQCVSNPREVYSRIWDWTYLAVSISWEELSKKVLAQFQVPVPVLTRKKNPSLTEVYTKLTDLVAVNKVKCIVSDFFSTHKKAPAEDIWRKIIEEVNSQFNVEIKDWQVLGATKSDCTKRTVTNKLIEVLQAKMWKI